MPSFALGLVNVKARPDNPRVARRSSQARAQRPLLGGVLVALGVGSVATARANLPPPPFQDWVYRIETTVLNADEFPDYVLVGYPCSNGAPKHEYCVIRSGDTVYRETQLYAIPAREVRVAPYVAADAGSKPPLVITRPRIDNPSAFLAENPRVIRGIETYPWEAGTTPKNSGINAAHFFLVIDRIDDKGVTLHFARATYSCGNGAQLERELGPRPAPWFPLCPSTDDHGELVAPDGGPGATSQPPVEPPPPPPRFAPRLLIQCGALVASVALMFGGLLLRRKS